MSIRIIVIGLALLAPAAAGAEEGAAMPLKVTGLLAEAKEPVRVVGFGDSITGVYYHTGGRRAWPEMLQIALRRCYPQTQVEVVNAGISGDTTTGGLARLERDVLRHKPHLVVAMFGMNDVVRATPEAYHDNLGQIVRRCREAGAEAILCTPNSVYPEDAGRPMERLAQYSGIVRQVGREMGVPVADCFAAYEALRAANRREWMGLMSETIHPNLRGHKVFAEEVAWMVSGRRVSLRDVRPQMPGLTRIPDLLARKQTVRVVAMAPYDTMIEAAVRSLQADARVAVTPWPVEGESLADIEKEAKARGWWTLREKPREQRPDLVILAVPAGAQAESEERFYRSYSWILNWSLNFGQKEWDCLVLLPSVAKPNLEDAERAAEATARYVVEAQDIPWLQRAPGDKTPAPELLARWMREQAGLTGQ